MSRQFRFVPPVVRPGTLTRPRLIRSLLRRWEQRLTLVVGGAGLGKTTLLAQALVENRLAPRGIDVWLGAEPEDDDDCHLCADLVTALGGQPTPHDDVAIVADLVWSRAPSQVCLLVDDVHLISVGSPGAAAFDALIEVLPANGHLVIASRVRPAVASARLAAHGAALEFGEADLVFDDEELVEFAARHAVDRGVIGATAGWPALAELAARASGPGTGDFVWEEVLRPLGDDERRVLAVVCDLGGGDDDLVSAALGEPVDVAAALATVPLIARDPTGWFRPHALWQPMAPRLQPEDRGRARRAAVRRLVERGRVADAGAVLVEAELWDEAPALLRQALLGAARPSTAQLRRWLDAFPDEVTASAAGRLAAGVLAAMVGAPDADRHLADAVALFRAADDVEGEIAALAHRGRVAWWRQDLAVLATLAPRVVELAAAGHVGAKGLERLSHAIYCDVVGDDEGMLVALDDDATRSLEPMWQGPLAWWRAIALHALGEPGRALDAIDAGVAAADPVFRLTLEFSRQVSLWALGRIDEARAPAAELRRAVTAAGVAHNIASGFAEGSRSASQLGDLDTAERLLQQARQALEPGHANAAVRVAVADASLHVAAGDEQAARRVLAAAITQHPLETGPPRRAWRDVLSLTYILVPEARATWDGASLRGHWRHVRDLAAAVVAGREPGADDPLDRVQVGDLGVVRSALHVRYAAELAVRLQQRARPEGAALLAALGAPGRAIVRELAERTAAPYARPAMGLLAAAPVPPPEEVVVAVLGPMEVHRAGAAVTGAELRRERVRALLAFLVSHRRTTRELVTATLWPDLERAAAANNLRVTLNHLLRELEPWRADGDPSYFVRSDESTISVSVPADTDEFDRHLRAAKAAETDGTASDALGHYLDAVALYRGDLFSDVTEADWFALDREHYRSRYLTASLRAAQLLLAGGDGDRAEELARRGLAVDPWSEPAYGVLVTAAVERGDHETARRLLDRCAAALADLGVTPSEATLEVQRRVRGIGRHSAPR